MSETVVRRLSVLAGRPLTRSSRDGGGFERRASPRRRAPLAGRLLPLTLLASVLAGLLASAPARPVHAAAGAEAIRQGAATSQQRRVVAYFPIWVRNSGYSETDVDFSIVTDVAHFSVVPRVDGSIEIPDWGPFPDPSLVARTHAAGARIVLVVGGDHAAATAGFAGMAASAVARQSFTANLVNMVAANGYDGVDLDWEYPASDQQTTDLTTLVADLRQALPPPLTVSMSVPPADWAARYFDVQAMLPNLDWIAALTYDSSGSSWSTQAGNEAPLYSAYPGESSVDASVTYYLQQRGVPRDKLLVGLPFFGARFDGASGLHQQLSSTSGSTLPYREIQQLLGQGWGERRDEAAGSIPYILNPGGQGLISFDDPISIRAKCRYLVDQQLGGVIIWYLSEDKVGGDQPLLDAARDCR